MFNELSADFGLSVLDIYSGWSEATETDTGSLDPARKSKEASESGWSEARVADIGYVGPRRTSKKKSATCWSEATETDTESLGSCRRSNKTSASRFAPTRSSRDFSQGQQGHFLESGRRLSLQDSHQKRKSRGLLSSSFSKDTNKHGSSRSSFSGNSGSLEKAESLGLFTGNLTSLRSSTGTVLSLVPSGYNTEAFSSSVSKNESSRSNVDNNESKRSFASVIGSFGMSADNNESLKSTASQNDDIINDESCQVSLKCGNGLGILDIYSGCHEETECKDRRRKLGRIESPLACSSISGRGVWQNGYGIL